MIYWCICWCTILSLKIWFRGEEKLHSVALQPFRHIVLPHNFATFCSTLNSTAPPSYSSGLSKYKNTAGQIQYQTRHFGLLQITSFSFINFQCRCQRDLPPMSRTALGPTQNPLKSVTCLCAEGKATMS